MVNVQYATFFVAAALTASDIMQWRTILWDGGCDDFFGDLDFEPRNTLRATPPPDVFMGFSSIPFSSFVLVKVSLRGRKNL